MTVSASATISTARPTNSPTRGCSASNSAARWRPTPTCCSSTSRSPGWPGGETSRISDLLEELRRDGVTLVVVDHNMHGLLELIDRAIVISFGRLIAEGTPDGITDDPEVREAYLGGDL